MGQEADGEDVRTYESLYHSADGSYSIIAKDHGDASWFVYQDGIAEQHIAIEIADALNTRALHGRTT